MYKLADTMNELYDTEQAAKFLEADVETDEYAFVAELQEKFKALKNDYESKGMTQENLIDAYLQIVSLYPNQPQAQLEMITQEIESIPVLETGQVFLMQVNNYVLANRSMEVFKAATSGDEENPIKVAIEGNDDHLHGQYNLVWYVQVEGEEQPIRLNTDAFTTDRNTIARRLKTKYFELQSYMVYDRLPPFDEHEIVPQFLEAAREYRLIGATDTAEAFRTPTINIIKRFLMAKDLTPEAAESLFESLQRVDEYSDAEVRTFMDELSQDIIRAEGQNDQRYIQRTALLSAVATYIEGNVNVDGQPPSPTIQFGRIARTITALYNGGISRNNEQNT